MASKSDVNKPTNNKIKEADIARKLQFYGIASAFQAGKVPSNDQIDVALNSFLASKAISQPSDKLSEEGKALISDFRDVVRQAKNVILSKNDGNILQDFIYESQQFDPKAIQGPGAPVDKDTAKGHGQDALQGLKTLGTLLVTNGQFRKLLKDATVLLRDVAGDAATKAATKVKPSEEELSKIDDAAEENKWHDAPKFSKEDAKRRMQGVYKGSPKKDLQEVRESGATAASNTSPDAPVQEKGQAGRNVAAASAKDKVAQNVPEETKDEIRARREEYRARTKAYFNQKLPEQRRDQVIFRLKKMVLECQTHPDYQQAIETLLSLAEQYGGHASATTKGGAQSAKQTRSHLKKSEDDLRTLIERFANGTSMSGVFEAINTIYKDADKDPELKDWFRSVNKYIRRCLQEQGYIMNEISNKDGHRIYDQGRYLLREKYRGHTNRAVDEVRFLADQFDQDPMNKSFGQAVQKLFKDLGQDSSGKPEFKPHLLKDLTNVILPAALENVAYIPIPRIEMTDPQMDMVIENLVLESDNFAPNVLEIDTDHSFRWGRKQVDKNFNRSHNSVQVSVRGIQMDLRDVSYYMKKKKGFPSITDQGVMDILLPGDGLSFKMKMATPRRSDRQHFFKVDSVDVDFKKLKINFKQSNHKFLLKIAQPLVMKALRPVITKAVEKAIKDEFTRMDALLHDVKTEAEKGAELDADNGAEKKASTYSRYAQAFKKKMLEGKEKAEVKTSDKKVNVAMTKEDSIFPNISLPGGVSTKATEYKELARKGDKWESPVFSIGKAGKTTKVPPPPEIRHKEAPRVTGTGSTPLSGSTTQAQTTPNTNDETAKKAGGPYLNGQYSSANPYASNNGQVGVSY